MFGWCRLSLPSMIMVVQLLSVVTINGLSSSANSPPRIKGLATMEPINRILPRKKISMRKDEIMRRPYFETSLHESKMGTTKQNVSEAVTKDRSKGILIGTLLVYLTSTTAMAKLNLIGPYTDALLARDIGLSLITTVLALAFVKVITALAASGKLQPRDSRKIIHTLSAPLFMLFWPFYSDVWGARLFAGSVAFLQALRLWLAAMNQGGSDGNELAEAISRSGDEKEALGGPFIYVVVLFAAITLCFRENFCGVMALSAMAAGDGMADIVGRRLGKGNKWFFSDSKSIAGTAAFIVASSLCSVGIGSWFLYTGAITTPTSFSVLAGKFILVSVLSAIAELIPIVDDNWSVPISAAAISSLILR